MSKENPKGMKGIRAKLARQKQATTAEVKRALLEAAKAIEQQGQELTALRRIIISERAQVIYYTEKYRSFVSRECVELVAVGFLDLSEAQQEHYIKLSIAELNGEASIVPHDAEAAAVEADSGKKIILQ